MKNGNKKSKGGKAMLWAILAGAAGYGIAKAVNKRKQAEIEAEEAEEAEDEEETSEDEEDD